MDWLKTTVQRICSCNILKCLRALTATGGPCAGLANLGLLEIVGAKALKKHRGVWTRGGMQHRS